MVGPNKTGADPVEPIRRLVEAGGDRDRILEEAVELIDRSGPLYDWTGIYLVGPGGALRLHTQVGPPTPHETIPAGRGICGAAAASGETILVPDVGADPRFLACSVTTRSEIVVPIRGPEGRVVGEIDIDSDTPAAFAQGDRSKLEECARLLGALFD